MNWRFVVKKFKPAAYGFFSPWKTLNVIKLFAKWHMPLYESGPYKMASIWRMLMHILEPFIAVPKWYKCAYGVLCKLLVLSCNNNSILYSYDNWTTHALHETTNHSMFKLIAVRCDVSWKNADPIIWFEIEIEIEFIVNVKHKFVSLWPSLSVIIDSGGSFKLHKNSIRFKRFANHSLLSHVFSVAIAKLIATNVRVESSEVWRRVFKWTTWFILSEWRLYLHQSAE